MVEHFDPAVLCESGAERRHPHIPFEDGRVRDSITRAAQHLGYTHFDCAQGYHNEELVGEALRLASVPRSSLFIATKLSDPNAMRGGEGAIVRVVEGQLRALASISERDFEVTLGPEARQPVLASRGRATATSLAGGCCRRVCDRRGSVRVV